MNCFRSPEQKCSDLLLRKPLLHIQADYSWTDAGIVCIGAARDIAAYAIGDFRGKCQIFCHGNGETAVSERYWFERLGRVSVPTLVIHGTADSIVPYSQGREVFRRIPVTNKRFVSVDGAGHCNFQYFLGEKYVPQLVDFMQGR